MLARLRGLAGLPRGARAPVGRALARPARTGAVLLGETLGAARGRAGRGDRGSPRRARVPPRAGARAIETASRSAVRHAQPVRRRGAAACRTRPSARASCTTPSRPATRHRPRGRPARPRARRRGRRPPPGARPPRGGRALRGPAVAGRAGRGARRLRLGALQRRALPRRGTRGQAAAKLYASLGTPVALGLCLVRVSRHWFMAGETAGAEECAEREVRILEAAGDEPRWPRPRSTRAPSSPCRGSRAAGAVLRGAAEPRAAAGAGPRRPAPELHRRRARGAGDPEGVEQVRESIELAAAGRHHEAARAATPTWPSCCCASGAWTSSRPAWPTAWPSPASAGSGRMPTTSRSIAAFCSCAAATGTAPRRAAPAGRCRRRPRDALRLQRALARAPARPARRSGGRGDARGGVGAGPAPPAAARPGLRGDRARRVGVARRPARRRRAGRGRAAGAHRASGRGAVPRRAAALPRPRGAAGGVVRRLPGGLGGRAGGRLARGRRGAGRRPAIPTRRPSSWRSPATRRTPARRCACSRTCGAEPAAARVRERLRAMGARVPRGPRAVTRANPAGSRRASSRSSACCARA